jgi:hypothetical protein
MATQTRNPTSEVAVTGTWSGTSRHLLLDDHPDSTNPAADVTTCSAAGTLVMGFSAFTVPANSTSISVQVLYYDFKNGSQASAAGSLLRCNDTTNRNSAATHNPGNGNANIALRTDDYTTNPKSAAAWTVDDVNGVGTNGLTAFGVRATDASPTVAFSSALLQVTYTPPSTPYSADLTAPAFGVTPQSVTRLNDYIAAITASTFAVTAQSLTRFNDWVTSLTAPVVNVTAQDLTWDMITGFTAELTAAAFTYTAQAVARFNDYVAQVTAASFGFTGQALTWLQNTIMALTAAAFTFVSRDLGWSISGQYLESVYMRWTKSCKRAWKRMNGPTVPW